MASSVSIPMPSYVLADSHSGPGEEQKVNFESMNIEKHTARIQAIQEGEMITSWPLTYAVMDLETKVMNSQWVGQKGTSP